MPCYINGFSTTELRDSLVNEFQIKPDEADKLHRAEFIVALYTYEDYSGQALVVYRIDNVLYEVNGSHCSCYGLEDQWDPEVADPREIVKRPKYGYDLSDEKNETIRRVIREALGV